MKLECGDEVTAEIWACVHGMELARELGFKKIILESDAAAVIDLLLSILMLSIQDGELWVYLMGLRWA